MTFLNKLKKNILVLLFLFLFCVPTILAKYDNGLRFHAKRGKGRSKVQVLPWNIDQIDAELSWSATNGTGVNVAILDTGVDIDHPDLEANIKGGINFATNRARKIYSDNYEDDYGHGTWVAGIVGAINNNIGVVGVAPDINIYVVRIGNKYTLTWDWITQGVEWCIENDMDVISMSFGSRGSWYPLERALIRAYDAGIVLVCSAGNDVYIEYPAKYDCVIAVGATDEDNNVPSWSGQGTELELTAPGVNIYSTELHGKYEAWDGTSASSPHVAGVVALILSIHPDWTPDQVRDYLRTNADDFGIEGKDNTYGYGLVDAEIN